MGAAGNKKKSSSSFLSCLFKGRRGGREKQEMRDEYVKAYNVYPSDEDRWRWWVAEPRIDEKASAYISLTTHKWGSIDSAAED